ncbi:hypothetical protein ACFWY6_05385 [Streptomyces sp. NPDC059037]|uniref:hypothetical protein n=1 Tax=Streptomyces sp. NPDC059037 TaxID=3346710 RepID=UPI003675E5A1
MATWGLVVETTAGMGERKHPAGFVIGHVEGTREDALTELERRARGYQPEHPRSPRRRRLYRLGDGFLLVIDGSWQSFSTRLTVAELVQDSAAPPPITPESEPEPGPEPTAAAPDPQDAVPPALNPDPQPTYDDGVPVRPSWWGRTDLS